MASDDDSEHEAGGPSVGGDSADSIERKLKAMLANEDLPSLRPATLHPGDRIAGTYVLGELLGRGGMGKVFLADHARTGGRVAIKLIRAARLAEDNAVRRFELEARHTAGLHHPNIVRVFDFGTDGDVLYLAMEYVPGRSLEKILATEGRLRLPTAVAIAEQVLQALDAAHNSDARIIHRDIKPANILVRSTEQTPFVKVLDFGIAKALEGPSANTQGAIGSPATMAPEQFDELPLSPATDLYALGCTMYAMVSGGLPFTGSYSQLAWKHCHETPPPLDSTALGIPAGMVDWINWLMKKEPADRPASAREARDRLLQLDLDSPAAHEPSNLEAGRTPIARHSITALLGALTIVGGVAWLLPRDASDSGADSAPPGDGTVEPPKETSDVIRAPLDEVSRPVERVQLEGKYPIRVSPGGDRMARGGDGVVIVDSLDTGPPARVEVPQGLEVDDVSWFPSNDRLLVTLTNRNESGLWSVGLDDRRWQNIVRHADQGRVAQDGERLLFVNRRNIHLTDVGGSETRTVASFPKRVNVEELVWLDDETVLVSLFDLNDEDSLGRIVALDVTTGDQTTLVEDQRLLVRGPVPFAVLNNSLIAYGWAERDFSEGAQVRVTRFDPQQMELVGAPTVVFDGRDSRDTVQAFSSSENGRLYFRRERELPKRYIAPIRRNPVRLGPLEEVPTQVAADWLPTGIWASAIQEGESLTSLIGWQPHDATSTPIAGPFDMPPLTRFAAAGGRSILALQIDDAPKNTVSLTWFDDFERLADTRHVLASKLPRWEPVIKCDRLEPPQCFRIEFSPGRIELFEVTAGGVGEDPIVSIPGPNPPTRSFDFADADMLVGYHDRVERYSAGGALEDVWRPPVTDTTLVRLQHVAYDHDGGFFVSGMFPQNPTYRMLHVSPDGATTTARSHRDEWMQVKTVSPGGRFLAFGNMEVGLEMMVVDLNEED